MIRVLDKNLKFLDFLRKYTFSRYTEKFRGIGTFQIDAQTEENMYLINKSQQYFVLFDSTHFGVVTGIKKQSDEEYENTIVITGKMATDILSRRIVYQTIKFKGLSKDFVKAVIDNNLVSAADEQRNMNMVLKFDEPSFPSGRCMSIDKSITGGYVWDRIEPILDADRLGVEIIPYIQIEGQTRALESNISGWTLTIKGGIDRTKGNNRGNTPVIFSQSYSNIESSGYNTNSSTYCNVAYIAGEGEGTERKWFKKEINQADSKGMVGWNRSELWIDARDIQSTDDEGNTMTDAQYEKLIVNRVNEKSEDAMLSELYESTIVKDNKQYVYGTDYNLGDFVTVVDDELGIIIDTQITEITVSEQGSEVITDIGLTYGKIEKSVIEKAIENQRNSTSNESNIKYLENRIKEIESSGGGGGTPTPIDNIDNITVSFTEAQTRENIQTGEAVKTLFGKIKKVFSDLKSVAFTGNYNDLSNKPTIPTIPGSLPANGGSADTAINADKLDGKHGEYYLNYNNFINTPIIPDIPDTSGLMPKSGGMFIGTVKFGGNEALPLDRNLQYILGINAFDSGGMMRYSPIEDVSVGNSTKFAGMTETQWKQWINDAIENAPAKVALGDVKLLSAEAANGGIKLSWEDPDDVVFNGDTLAEYGGTKVLRKQGSYSVSETDGTLVVDETSKNSYKTNPYFDTDVEAGVSYNYTLFPRTKDNVVTLSDNNKISGMPLSFSNVLENNTWDQIAYASELGIASTLWNVGDTKDGCAIVGFDHDTIYNSNKKAGISFVCKNSSFSMSGVWHSSTSYATEYNNSAANSNLNFNSNGVYNSKIPEGIRKHIKQVTKQYINTISSVESSGFYLFLFSAYEIWGSSGSSYKEGEQYEGHSYIGYTSSDSWLRSRTGYSSKNAYYLTKSGSRSSAGVNYSKYYLYGFCI